MEKQDGIIGKVDPKWLTTLKENENNFDHSKSKIKRILNGNDKYFIILSLHQQGFFVCGLMKMNHNDSLCIS